MAHSLRATQWCKNMYIFCSSPLISTMLPRSVDRLSFKNCNFEALQITSESLHWKTSLLTVFIVGIIRFLVGFSATSSDLILPGVVLQAQTLTTPSQWHFHLCVGVITTRILGILNMCHACPEKSSCALEHRFLLHPFIPQARLSHQENKNQKTGGHLLPLILSTAVKDLPEMKVFQGWTFSSWAGTWIQVPHFSGVCPRDTALLPKIAPPSPPLCPTEMSNGIVFSNAWVRHLSLGLGNFPSEYFMLGTVMAEFESGFSKWCKSHVVTPMLLHQPSPLVCKYLYTPWHVFDGGQPTLS